jgi:hypothetical protein
MAKEQMTMRMLGTLCVCSIHCVPLRQTASARFEGVAEMTNEQKTEACRRCSPAASYVMCKMKNKNTDDHGSCYGVAFCSRRSDWLCYLVERNNFIVQRDETDIS